MDGLSTKTATMPAQAIVQDKDTYFESANMSVELSRGSAASASKLQGGPLKFIFIIIFVIFYIIMKFKSFSGH